MTFLVRFLLVVVSAVSSIGFPKEVRADLRSAVQNPISSLISLPFKFTFDDGAKNGDGTIMNVNPVVPVTVGDWNQVNRALIPVGNVNGAIAGP